jgi:serine/threonine-protein kinase
MLRRFVALLTGFSVSVLLAACSGGGDSASAPRSYTVGGTVSGLVSGTKLVLTDNGSDSLTVSANGTFTFDKQVAANGSYNVTIASQPAGQTCSVSHYTGAGVTSDVTSVAVTCSANSYTVGGSLSGLAADASLVLQDNGGDALTLSANGAFVFGTAIAQNGSYAVTVAGQPTGQTCTVSQGSGAGMDANVGNVSVLCSTMTYTIGGTVSGLSSGAQVTLADNSGDPLTVDANGAFMFATPVAYGSSYSVTVLTQPVGEVCTATGSGTGVAADVSTVAVTCSTSTYKIGGTLTGLATGGQVTLENNSGDALSLTADGPFTFVTPVAYGGSYNVTVGTQPHEQQCTATVNVGTDVTADVTAIQINCVTGQVSALAGSINSGHADGTGAAASFHSPAGLAVDSSGNVYVGDEFNEEIRKITSAGVVTTLAGSTTSGSSDGTGASASFLNPFGVAVDSSGNVYVADLSNSKLRKITPAGVVTTLAGSASPGHADGPGTSASFNGPVGVAVDSDGNVYVADEANNEIRKITPAGDVTTLAGSTSSGHADGTGAAASFSNPEGVAVDSSGNVYVADSWNNEIRKITPAGVVTTLAGSTAAGHTDGTGAAATFNSPVGVAVDSSGNVYVTDGRNNEIRKITPAGEVTTLAGSITGGHADGTSTSATFNQPAGIAVDSSGNVYVADQGNNEIRMIGTQP